MLENKINRLISIKSISNFVRSSISVCITASQNPRLRDKISRFSCVAAGPKSMSMVARCVGGRIELVGDPAQEIEPLILICPRASRLGYKSERNKLSP